MNRSTALHNQVDSVLPADGGAPAAPGLSLHGVHQVGGAIDHPSAGAVRNGTVSLQRATCRFCVRLSPSATVTFTAPGTTCSRNRGSFRSAGSTSMSAASK